MFGYIRFALAFLVMLSHIGVRVYGLNPGVMAVVIFYILAGYVVSHLFNDILVKKNHRIVLFYKDRAFRIFPLYMYTLIVTLCFLALTSFGKPHYSLSAMVANILIIPLNYYMYYDFTILSNPNWCLIPPAWSLGTELQAYLLLPLVLLCRPLKIIAALLSLGVYLAANFSFLHPDYFGYRFIVGVFFIFIIGSTIQYTKTLSTEKNFFETYFPRFIWLTILLLVPLFYYLERFSPTYTKETFIGLLVGIPLVIAASKVKRKILGDALLASLSYAIFLSHFLAIWILEYSGYTATHTASYITLLTLVSLTIGYLGVKFIEKPLQSVRFRH